MMSSHSKVYVNGNRVENASVLIPSVSDLQTRVLVHAYDVARWLKPGGGNVVGIWVRFNLHCTATQPPPPPPPPPPFTAMCIRFYCFNNGEKQ